MAGIILVDTIFDPCINNFIEWDVELYNTTKLFVKSNYFNL